MKVHIKFQRYANPFPPWMDFPHIMQKCNKEYNNRNCANTKKEKNQKKNKLLLPRSHIWTSPKQFTIPNRWKSNADCLTNPTDQEFNDDCFNKWCWSLRTSGIGINRWDRQANKEKMIWGTQRGFARWMIAHIFSDFILLQRRLWWRSLPAVGLLTLSTGMSCRSFGVVFSNVWPFLFCGHF